MENRQFKTSIILHTKSSIHLKVGTKMTKGKQVFVSVSPTICKLLVAFR